MAIELDRILLSHANGLLQPLLTLRSEDGLFLLLQRMGWDADCLGLTDPAVFSQAIDAIIEVLDELEMLIQQDSFELSDLAQVLIHVAEITVKMATTISELSSANIPEGVYKQLADDVMRFVVVNYLAVRFPMVTVVLEMLGVYKCEEVEAIPIKNGFARKKTIQYRIDTEALWSIVNDPMKYIKKEFLESTEGQKRLANEVAGLLGPKLADAFSEVGITSSYGLPSESGIDLTPEEIAAAQKLFMLTFIPYQASADTRNVLRFIFALTDTAAGLGVLFVSNGTLTIQIPLSNGNLAFKVQGTQSPLLITKDSVDPAPGTIAGGTIEVEVGYKTNQNVQPALRFGSGKSTHFDISSIESSIGLKTISHDIDLGGKVDLRGLQLVIQGGDGDGFIARLLPKDPIILKADICLDMSLKKGVSLQGGGGFETVIPINESIFDVVMIESMYLSLLLKDKQLKMILAVSANAKLGPFSASVSKLGLAFKLGFPSNTDLQFALGFKPPDGAGLSIDTSVITGGGFLFIDEDKGQYAGGLQLDIKKKIAITAIGLINTKLPDGRKIFSLLVIISAEFPAIQLGFGFSLNGIGGLLGVNRTMMVDVLRAGIKNRVLNSIMFPKDIVQNATKIISDLSSIFPPAEGRFTFGIMVKICWGNSLITADLGIIIELPSPVRLAIIGRLQLALPTEEDAIISLHMDTIGILDFDQSMASIDASLYDSRIAVFDLAGDMAMRLGWGAKSIFALSVGGFHPKFTPPSDFPKLARMSISLSSGEDMGIRLETYFAVTSNSFQFGGRLDGHFKKDLGDLIGTLSVEAYLALDALIKWPPFWFEVSISAGIDVKRNGEPLVSADLYIALSGPCPWIANGKARIEFLGSHEAEFSWQSDDPEEKPRPTPPDLFKELRDALLEPSSWSAQMSGSSAGVTLRKLEEAEVLLVHPFGSLTLRQRVVPINIKLERAGSIPLEQPVRYTIVDIKVAEFPNDRPTEVRDAFAPGQFFELSDSAKLQRPAFEDLPSGFTELSGGQGPAMGNHQGIDWNYEIVVIDGPERIVPPKDEQKGEKLPPNIADKAVSRGAAGQATIRRIGSDRYANPASTITVQVNNPTYHVTSLKNLTVPNGTSTIPSYVEAEALQSEDGTADSAQVVVSHEVMYG